MTPVDAFNFLDGKLRLALHHHNSRTEAILMDVPGNRQFTVDPDSLDDVRHHLDAAEMVLSPEEDAGFVYDALRDEFRAH